MKHITFRRFLRHPHNNVQVRHQQRPRQRLSHNLKPRRITNITRHQRPFNANSQRHQTPHTIRRRLNQVIQRQPRTQRPQRLIMNIQPRRQNHLTHLHSTLTQSISMRRITTSPTNRQVLRPIRRHTRSPRTQQRSTQNITQIRTLLRCTRTRHTTNRPTRQNHRPRLIMITTTQVRTRSRQKHTSPINRIISMRQRIMTTQLLTTLSRRRTTQIISPTLNRHRRHNRQNMNNMTIINTTTTVRLITNLSQHPQPRIIKPTSRLQLLIRITMRRRRILTLTQSISRRRQNTTQRLSPLSNRTNSQLIPRPTLSRIRNLNSMTTFLPITVRRQQLNQSPSMLNRLQSSLTIPLLNSRIRRLITIRNTTYRKQTSSRDPTILSTSSCAPHQPQHAHQQNKLPSTTVTQVPALSPPSTATTANPSGPAVSGRRYRTCRSRIPTHHHPLHHHIL